MNALRHALLIARRDLVLIIWRIEGLVWIFIMPIVFFYFIGIVTGGLGTLSSSSDDPDLLALTAPDNGGVLIDQLVARLEEQNFRVDRPETEEVRALYARQLTITADSEDATVPEGSLTDWALAGNTIVLHFESTLEGPGAVFDQIRVARAAYTVLADAVVIDVTGATMTDESFAELAAMPRRLSLDVRPAGRRELPPVGFAQSIPGTMVMFTMLILVTAGAIHLVIERREGLLCRLASAPISRCSIVLGKLVGRTAVAMVQIAFAMVAAVVLFQMDWGPSLPMVVLVLLGWSLFNASLAVVVGNFVKTESQANGIGVMVSLLLAALGGAWWPIEITPEWMQRLAMFLPTGWAMDAMHKLVNFAYEPVVALPHLAGMLVGAAVLGGVAARTFRYQ
ncbi:MAG: ABC transporter permease [Acidobacteriota bacterium]|jgi:ABC-2 type transport system permease protein